MGRDLCGEGGAEQEEAGDWDHWRGSCGGAGVSSQDVLVRGLDSHPADAVKRSEFRRLGRRAVRVREEENGKTSGRFYLENCREDREEFEVAYHKYLCARACEPCRGLCVVLFEAGLCHEANAACWCAFLRESGGSLNVHPALHVPC